MKAKVKKKGRSALAIALVLSLLVGTAGISAFATSSSQKEEVIYVSTDASGAVKNLTAVNIFDESDFDDASKITDYGDYSAVKILTGDATVNQSGKKVTVKFANADDSDDERIYYQGTMKDTEIPWNISICYYLDGKKISADDLAGKSGKLKIHFCVTENSEYSRSGANGYFDNYALQTSFTLDTEKCDNIKAADATIANVGQDKQLSYIVLPDKGIDTYITANVTDFEMDAVSINGVKLNMNIDVDDEEIQNKVEDAQNAVKKLDDSADKLSDGASELSSGLSKITKKNSELTDGAYKAFQGICESSETVLNNMLSQAGMSSVNLTPETYATVLNGLMEKLEPVPAYKQAYNQIKSLKEQLDEYKTFYNGVCDYTDAVSEAKNGASKLSKNTTKFAEKTGELKDSVGEFREKIDEVCDWISSLQGEGDDESFVSSKNGSVKSVQFVIKTDPISMDEPEETTTTETEELSFWQKLLDLFGL